MQRVASFLKKERKQVQYILRIPKDKPIGKVFWSVQSSIEPVTFTRKKDAECFKDLLNNKAVHSYNADIVRREVTEDGYEPTYGDEKK